MGDHPHIVAYVLTRNEEDHIGRAVSSLQRVTTDVVVVDSESTDETRTIAHDLGAHVVVHPFAGFAAQRNWALSYLAEHYSPDYILALDADESLGDDLVTDLRSRLSGAQRQDDAYLINRRVTFDGRLLRWGGFANTWLPRLFRPSVGRYEDRTVNEHLSLSPSASVGRLRGYFINHDVESWTSYIAKHNRYSSFEAQVRVQRTKRGAPKTSLVEALRRPYLRRRWLRESIWDRLPARPAVRFVQLYILAGGLLDGRPGFRRALFESWQEMCTDLKAEELVRSGAL